MALARPLLKLNATVLYLVTGTRNGLVGNAPILPHHRGAVLKNFLILDKGFDGPVFRA